MPPIPYCGTPPLPGELLARFNLDPVLISSLLALAVLHRVLLSDPRMCIHALAGWTVATVAFLSPLCALVGVALFRSRRSAHVVGIDRCTAHRARLADIDSQARHNGSGAPRDCSSPPSGSGTCRAPMTRLSPRRPCTGSCASCSSVAASCCGGIYCIRAPSIPTPCCWPGFITSTQMCLLGAMLSLAGRPLFDVHFLTALVEPDTAAGPAARRHHHVGTGHLPFSMDHAPSLQRLFSLVDRTNAA